MRNFGDVVPATYSAFTNYTCEPGCTVLTCSCSLAFHYWSSTTPHAYFDYALLVDFYAGLTQAQPKLSLGYVRAVRAGS